MPTAWSRASAAHRPRIAILKDVKVPVGGHTLSALRWLLRQGSRVVLSMSALYDYLCENNRNQLMKKIIALCLLVAFGSMLSACNTVKGFGKDVETVGEKMQGSK